MTLPDGSMVLEDDGGASAESTMAAAMAAAKEPPAPEPEPEPAPVAAAPAVVPVAAEGDDEPAVSDAQTMVPLEALKEARAHLKSLKAQVGEMDALRQRAAQADAILPVVEQWRPVIEAIQRDPGLMERTRQTPAADPYAAKVTDQEAAEYAKDIQLYTPEGQLDVATARRALAREHKIASVAAQEAARSVVAPLQRESAGLKAQQARDWAVQSAAQEGEPVDPAVFDSLWRNLPPELVAQNPAGIGQLVKLVARGMTPRKAAAPAPPPPVIPTEPAGGRTSVVAALTDLDRRFAREMGKKPSEYQAQAAKWQQGTINVLED